MTLLARLRRFTNRPTAVSKSEIAKPTPPCDACGPEMAGVNASIDTASRQIGVERCDGCQVFEGDLDAAWALAQVVGGQVWFYQHGEGGDVAPNGSVEGRDATSRQFMGTYRDDDCIATGTDPWIEDCTPALFDALVRRAPPSSVWSPREATGTTP